MDEPKEHVENVCSDSIVSNVAAPNIDVIWSTTDALPLTHFTNEVLLMLQK